MDPCPRFLTPHDTHNLCVICLGKEHARSVLEGAVCMHCEHFQMKKLRSCLLAKASLVQAPVPRDSGPALVETGRRLRSWESQVELAEEFEIGINLLHSSVADERELLMYSVLHVLIQQPLLCWRQSRVSRKWLMRAKSLK